MAKKLSLPMPVGIIDLGAHSIRLDIFQLESDRGYRLLESLSQPVNLGREVFSRGEIQAKSINLVSSVMADYALKLKEYGVVYCRAFATSAVREALNRGIFLDRIKAVSRIKLEVLESGEETRLIYLAIKNILKEYGDMAGREVLYLTLGTGSTGMAFSRDGRLVEAEVFGFGTLRLLEEIGDPGLEPQRLNGVMDSFAVSLEKLLVGSVGKGKPLFVSGGAGVRLLARLAGKDIRENKVVVVTASELDVVSAHLTSSRVEELAEELGVADYMARGLEPCCYLLRHMCGSSGIEQVIVPMVSTRDAVIEEVVRDVFGDPDPFVDDILSCAVAVGEKYRNETMHGLAVAETAVAIFDRLSSLHRLDSNKRLLLRLAAILHDVGRFIDSRKHHKHSCYIIENTQIPGLCESDMLVAAVVARYHRKSEPKVSHAEYMSLPEDERIVVCKLAAILRVADALDRGHQDKMKGAEFRLESGCLRIIPKRNMDYTLERVYLKKKASLFRNVYGCKVVLE